MGCFLTKVVYYILGIELQPAVMPAGNPHQLDPQQVPRKIDGP